MKIAMEKKRQMEEKLQFFVREKKVEICITDVQEGKILFSISGPRVEFDRAVRNLKTFKTIEITSESHYDEELAESFGYYQLNLKKP